MTNNSTVVLKPLKSPTLFNRAVSIGLPLKKKLFSLDCGARADVQATILLFCPL